MLFLFLTLNQIEVGIGKDILTFLTLYLIIQLEVEHLRITTLKRDHEAIARNIFPNIVLEVSWCH